jgi:hypothetical protein
MFDPETPNALIPSASKSVSVDDAVVKVTIVFLYQHQINQR